MAKKSEKTKRSNQNLITGIFAIIFLFATIAIAIFFITKNPTGLNDSYFVSDNTKYVLTIDKSQLSSEDNEYTPLKTHIVYYYSGDTITGVTTYAEYADEAIAKAILNAYQKTYDNINPSESGIKNISTNGKYLVIISTEDQYANITVSDVKQQIEFMEMLQNTDPSDNEKVEIETDTTGAENNAE